MDTNKESATPIPEEETKQKRRAAKKKAETAQELKDKYNRKRLTAKTAAQFWLYNVIYWAYLKNEGVEPKALQRIVNDDTKIFDLLMRDQSAENLYNIYADYTEWIDVAFENAVLVRNTLAVYIKTLYSEAVTAVSGEHLREELTKASADGKIRGNLLLWLRDLTAEPFRPQRACYYDAVILRQEIDKSLRYLNAFNTLIQMQADMMEIPELTVFQVDMDKIETGITELNDVLEVISELISRREVVSEEEAKAKPKDAETLLFPPLSQAELEEMLQTFKPIAEIAPPIPKENIAAATFHIKTILSTYSNFSWSGSFKAIRRDYWRR